MTDAKPRIVLFSGGSASNELAISLEKTGAEIVHVITVFDNGGSTGELRRVSPIPFPAIGDIRKRLIWLAPSSTSVQAAIRKLFNERFSLRKSEKQLRYELHTMSGPEHPLISRLPANLQEEILGILQCALNILPVDFPLRDLSVGNLLIFGRTLQTKDCLEAIHWARRLLEVSSEVLPVTLDSVHLGALCEGDQWVHGQASITDHTVTLPGRLERVCFLQQEGTHAFTAKAEICPAVATAMAAADAFVLGFGSFLTSILPHFLVRGVGAAFTNKDISKIFLVNPTTDKETSQFTAASMVEMVSQYARADKLPHGPQKVITDVLYFGSEKETRIPAGNVSALAGRFRDITAVEGFEKMSRRAAEIVAGAVGLKSSPNRPGSATPRPVVLFDLDATLFDYPQLRKDATARALEGMVSDPVGISRDLFELLRYPLANALVGLGFSDLRRGWDSPEVLVFALLLDDPSSRAALLKLSEMSRASGTLEEDVSFAGRILSYQRAARLRAKTGVQALLRRVDDLRQRLSSTLGERALVFRKYVESSASLAPGATELITDSLEAGAEVHVVSEGDFAVQRFKFDSLKLKDLVSTCIVTDVTCGVGGVLDELFLFYKDLPIKHISPAVVELYDQLAPLTIKSPAFYTKLLHALRDSASGNLQDRMKSPRFLTSDEWESGLAYCLVMIGDRYRKDLEPLLQVCPTGLQSFRVVTGRYLEEDPLHEIVLQGRPIPTLFAGDLLSLKLPVAATLHDFHESVQRPVPILPSSTTIQTVLKSCSGLSKDGKRTLDELQSEVLRHRETSDAVGF